MGKKAIFHRRHQGEHRERSHPRNRKYYCRKIMLFPKALVLATTLPKIVKNSISLMNFYQNFSKISQNFSTICAFRPNARKINAWFVKLFEKYAKIMDFRNFLKKFFENLRKFSGARGAEPRAPHEADLVKLQYFRKKLAGAFYFSIWLQISFRAVTAP